MEEERKVIKEKYARNVNRIIEKYQDCSDDSLEVLGIFSGEEEPTFHIDSISFIRNGQRGGD